LQNHYHEQGLYQDPSFVTKAFHHIIDKKNTAKATNPKFAE